MLTAASALAAVVGFADPKNLGGYPLAIAGLGGLSVVLFIAVVRLHPDFPAYRVVTGPVWAFDHPEHENEQVIVLEVEFTNREPAARIHLVVELWWTYRSKARVRGLLRRSKVRQLGPYRFWPYTAYWAGTRRSIDQPTSARMGECRVS